MNIAAKDAGRRVSDSTLSRVAVLTLLGAAVMAISAVIVGVFSTPEDMACSAGASLALFATSVTIQAWRFLTWALSQSRTDHAGDQ